MSRVLDVDPLTGLTVSFRYDAAQERVIIGHHQDAAAVQAVLDDNQAARLDTDMHRRGAKEEWSLYARVPNIVQMEWLQKYGVDFGKREDFKKCMQLINSPDYQHVKRTTYFHDR